ncbi:hypothetical protein BV22DRAFT_1024491, partial [Leucogyrophana mollusca]
PSSCHGCGNDGPICCLLCANPWSWCSGCVVKHHVDLPFHKLEIWEGTSFVATSLCAHGFIWHLGHGGVACPRIPGDEEWVDLEEEKDAEGAQWEEETGGETSAGSTLAIVHSTGVFSHQMKWCHCAGAPKRHMQLLKAGLFTASVTRPQTAFTFEVLDCFHIDALECKTSAMSFYQKVKCLTCNAFPMTVPVCRPPNFIAWRDLMVQKCFGFRHDVHKTPQEGDLVLFCPACPQPGVILPEDWATLYEEWAVMMRLVTDGNFSAQSQKLRNPDDDVALTGSSEGYMVGYDRYEAHLNIAKESKDGERQMNMDYSICNALNYNSTGMRNALIIYDIGCQWGLKLAERVKCSPYLKIPLWMKILIAIGKFHLSAHKRECYVRFTLNYLVGAGQIDGEILETLWAPFNKISSAARSMTKAHRAEIYDDHMRDSNWKKLVGMSIYPKIFPSW